MSPRIVRRKGIEGKTGTYLEYQYDLGGIEQYKIFVNPDDRRKGIATSMFKELVKIAKSKKIEKIVVRSTTDPSREVFGKWLIKRGFKRVNNPIYQWEYIIKNK